MLSLKEISKIRFKPRPEILQHPNIPKPLHCVAPRTILGDVWWTEQRKIAYKKTQYHCAACGVHASEAKYHQWLEAHELYEFDYPNGKMVFKEIVALCHMCHNFIHSGRMQALVDKGEMDKKKHHDILAHGNKLIANLPKSKEPKGIAAWKDWRLVLFGNEYKGKFANYQEWLDYFHPKSMRDAVCSIDYENEDDEDGYDESILTGMGL